MVPYRLLGVNETPRRTSAKLAVRMVLKASLAAAVARPRQAQPAACRCRKSSVWVLKPSTFS